MTHFKYARLKIKLVQCQKISAFGTGTCYYAPAPPIIEIHAHDFIYTSKEKLPVKIDYISYVNSGEVQYFFNCYLKQYSYQTEIGTDTYLMHDIVFAVNATGTGPILKEYCLLVKYCRELYKITKEVTSGKKAS